MRLISKYNKGGKFKDVKELLSYLDRLPGPPQYKPMVVPDPLDEDPMYYATAESTRPNASIPPPQQREVLQPAYDPGSIRQAPDDPELNLLERALGYTTSIAAHPMEAMAYSLDPSKPPLSETTLTQFRDDLQNLTTPMGSVIGMNPVSFRAYLAEQADQKRLGRYNLYDHLTTQDPLGLIGLIAGRGRLNTGRLASQYNFATGEFGGQRTFYPNRFTQSILDRTRRPSATGQAGAEGAAAAEAGAAELGAGGVEASIPRGPGASGGSAVQYAQGPRPGNPSVRDYGPFRLVIHHPRDREVMSGNVEPIEVLPNDASSVYFGSANVGQVERYTGQDRFRNKAVHVPDIKSESARQKLGTAMTDQDMAKGIHAMLSAIPNGEVVFAGSLSSDSLPIILQNWARGRVSNLQPTQDELANHDVITVRHEPLNDYGKTYENSEAVESWHDAQAEAAAKAGQPHVFTDSDGMDWDNRFLPENQMSFEEFVTIDPTAMRFYKEGNMRAAERQYEYYQNQSVNEWAVSPMTGFSNLADKMKFDERNAQILADRFNAKLDAAAAARGAQVQRQTERGRNIADDEGMGRAQIHYISGPGQDRWEVEYPVPVVVKNFRKGGRMNLKKKRKPGIRVMR